MKKRNCIIKKLWSDFTPYIQASGWMIMMCGGIMATIALMEKAAAFNDRITVLEAAIMKVAVMEEKLDLVIQLLRDK